MNKKPGQPDNRYRLPVQILLPPFRLVTPPEALYNVAEKERVLEPDNRDYCVTAIEISTRERRDITGPKTRHGADVSMREMASFRAYTDLKIETYPPWEQKK